MRLKRIERTYRKWILSAASELLRTRVPLAPLDWTDRPHRVLYLRTDRIGDMVMATGLLRTIATSHPTISVDVLASPLNTPVLAKCPVVRRVIVLDRRRPWRLLKTAIELRGRRCDAVFAGRGIDHALTVAVPPAAPHSHYITQHRHAAATWIAHGVDSGQRFLVNVSAGHRKRQWPEDRVVAVL
jgi:ADP-heptose:LPS heptosyltransferase